MEKDTLELSLSYYWRRPADRSSDSISTHLCFHPIDILEDQGYDASIERTMHAAAMLYRSVRKISC